MIDKELCITALKNGGMILHVPHQFLDADLLNLALELKQSLEGFPLNLLSREMCMNALRNKHKLSNIPYELYDREMIM